jgi:hypothetical protein
MFVELLESLVNLLRGNHKVGSPAGRRSMDTGSDTLTENM